MNPSEATPPARRRARVLRIRRTVAAVSIAVFLALFATIYVQMASGKDPALGTSVVATANATAQNGGATDATSTASTDSGSTAGDQNTDDGYGYDDDSGHGGDDTSQSTSQPAGVTTSQS